jgi:hypothetical protein
MTTARTHLRRLVVRLHLVAGAALVGGGHGFGQPTPGERAVTRAPAAGVAATVVVRRAAHVSGVLGRLLAILDVGGSVIRLRRR